MSICPRTGLTFIALPNADYDRQLLIGVLSLTKHAKTLAGFCEFTADPDDIFGTKSEPPQQLVQAIHDAIHGPPRKGFTPMFESGHSKGLPGGDETVNYPGDYHYLARAIIQSGKTGIPLLNDIPGLKLPGMLDIAPQDDAKLLAGILAVECTRIALPPTPYFDQKTSWSSGRRTPPCCVGSAVRCFATRPT